MFVPLGCQTVEWMAFLEFHCHLLRELLWTVGDVLSFTRCDLLEIQNSKFKAKWLTAATHNELTREGS